VNSCVKYPYVESFPVFDFQIAACFTLKQLQKISPLETQFLDDGCLGMAISTPQGAIICVDTAVTSELELIMIIAHESTHAWQFLRDQIAEENPSMEFEAYHVGYITMKVYEWYQAHMKKTNKKAKKTK
jgi:hypothetical protein